MIFHLSYLGTRLGDVVAPSVEAAWAHVADWYEVADPRRVYQFTVNGTDMPVEESVLATNECERCHGRRLEGYDSDTGEYFSEECEECPAAGADAEIDDVLAAE